MPFLRVIRDKRGYETTYLMHWYRDGARQRSRILYVFRSPGGVRVGRESLDADVRRDIESQYPEIAFDWKSVIANQQVIESVEPRRPRRKRRDEGETEPAGTPAAAASSSKVSIPSAVEGATPDEQVAFLNHWYPVIRDRIPQRTSDPVRQDALRALAERLNPATWTDADQTAEGLQRAAEALERLSHVFSRRRRGRRRVTKPSASVSPEGPASDV